MSMTKYRIDRRKALGLMGGAVSLVAVRVGSDWWLPWSLTGRSYWRGGGIGARIGRNGILVS